MEISGALMGRALADGSVGGILFADCDSRGVLGGGV